ncbi:MAG: hypothetical protein ABIT83_22890 [Massilia sp.]
MDKSLLLVLPFVLILPGCSVGYDMMRDHAERDCKQKVIADRDECMKRLVPNDYDKYQRDSDKIRKERPTTSTPP